MLYEDNGRVSAKQKWERVVGCEWRLTDNGLTRRKEGIRVSSQTSEAERRRCAVTYLEILKMRRKTTGQQASLTFERSEPTHHAPQLDLPISEPDGEDLVRGVDSENRLRAGAMMSEVWEEGRQRERGRTSEVSLDFGHDRLDLERRGLTDSSGRGSI